MTTTTSSYSSMHFGGTVPGPCPPVSSTSRQQSPCSFMAAAAPPYDAATASRHSYPAYDPATPNNNGIILAPPTTAVTPPTNLTQTPTPQQDSLPTGLDSDCGSSSGLGGMTNKHGCSSDASSMDSDSRDSGGGGGGGGGPNGPPQILQQPTCPAIYANSHPRLFHQPAMAPTAAAAVALPPTATTMVRPSTIYTMTFDPTVLALASAPSTATASGTTVAAGGYQEANGPLRSAVAPGMSAGPATPSVPNQGPAIAGAVPPGIPHIPGAGTSNDVFVHVQPGENITLMIGNEPLNIAGPATIRMVGQSGVSPSALPLHVPRGHVVQQILDEQGCLRHVILSPQTAPANSRPMPSSVPTQLPNAAQLRESGATTPLKPLPGSPKSSSPPMVPPYPPPSLLNATPISSDMIIDPGVPYISGISPARNWSHGVPSGKGSSISGGIASIPSTAAMSHAEIIHPYNGTLVPDEETPCGIEEDERERLKETLNGIQAPTIIRVSSREAEISWQELDTSEAAASGGPFPQIDASEFTYEIFVHEGSPNGRVATQHRCDPNGSPSCRLKITRLKPFTDYYVHIRASLPERDLYGYPSAAAYFRTQPNKPEAPAPPRIQKTASTWVNVSWRAPSSNGSPISSYALQVAKGKNEPFVNAYEGPNEQTRVNGLEPGTYYRFRVIARNECGQSDPSAMAYATTPVSNGQPPATSFTKIPQPTVLSVSAKSAKLSWAVTNDYSAVVLEICDISRGNNYAPINQECYSHSGTSALVNGLQSNREYRFRVAATLYSTGDTHKSDYVSLRTHKDRYENSAYQNQNYQNYQNAMPEKERVPTPINLQRIFDDENTVEIGWKYPGKDFDAVSYVVEATTLANADQLDSTFDASSLSLHELPWRVFYRGTSTTAKIDDSQVCLFRVQSIRRQITSSWSEPLYVKRYQMRHKKSAQPLKPSACIAPKFSNITWCAMDIVWRLQAAINHVDPSSGKEEPSPTANMTLIYELQRVDKQPIIIYSGDESEYHLENLKPVEHVQVRARAVIVDYEGKRVEGDWSPIGSACTLCHAPSPPSSLRVDMDAKSLRWDVPALLNGAEISHYIVYSTRYAYNEDGSEEAQNVVSDEQFAKTTSNECSLESLIPANRYIFAVIAVNEGGSSEKSEPIEYNSPPAVPDAPENIGVEAISTSELAVYWSKPKSNGSTIVGFKITVYERMENGSAPAIRQQILQQSISASTTTYNVQKLNPETVYEIEITAENSVGKSEKERITGETLAPPPEPPILCLAQASANTLKLRWTNAPSSSKSEPIYYYLEKENENGTFSPVIEGEIKTAKVKGLKECTPYRFRIRSALTKLATPGAWSQAYTFNTTRSPPPAVRAAPMVTEVPNSNAYQIEWQSIRLTPANVIMEEEMLVPPQIVYRLQVAPRSGREKTLETWKTVYEGASTSYTLTVPSVVPRQARVFVVHLRDNEDEVVSAASPIVTFGSARTPTDSPRKRQKPLNGSASGASTPNSTVSSGRSSSQVSRMHKMSLYKRFKKILLWFKKAVTEKDCAFIVLAIFCFTAVAIAVLLNNYYEF